MRNYSDPTANAAIAFGTGTHEINLTDTVLRAKTFVLWMGGTATADI